MADVSYLLNNIPNKVVTITPELSTKYYLLGALPNNQAFLLVKYTTVQQNNLTSGISNIVTQSSSVPAPTDIGMTLPVSNTTYIVGTSQSSLTAGLLIYNTDTSTIQQYLSGKTWQLFTVLGAGSFENPMKAAGDIIIGGDLGTPKELVAGPDGTALQISNGIPIWAPFTQSSGNELNFNLINITANYTILPTDYTVCADCSSGTIVVSCPISGIRLGQCFIIKRIDGSINSVVVDGSGNLIDGLPTLPISNQWDDVSIQWTGTAWIEI
jgi:hypothetical protein